MWGSGSYFRLGNGLQDDQFRPGLVPGFSGIPIRQVAFGSRHTLALTWNGDVYAWGSNDFGQCGVEPTECPEGGIILYYSHRTLFGSPPENFHLFVISLIRMP